jgi:hypothetical protein
MAIAKNDTHKDYTRYAAHCLNMIPATKDQTPAPSTARWQPNG